jgi:tetratricopeptide (TPR) repeat protein
MAAELFEDVIELEVPLLEAVSPTAASYPLPALKSLGKVEKREFPCVVLENPYLRASIVPALGGRLASLFDKRSSQELFTGALQEEGPRGCTFDLGARLVYGQSDRLNGAGTVHYLPVEGVEDGDPASVWIGEVCVGSSISFNACWALPPQRAEIRLEWRTLNRSLKNAAYDPALLLSNPITLSSPQIIYDGRRFAHPAELGPRQADTWRVVMTPTFGPAEPGFVNSEAWASISQDSVWIGTVEARLGHKLVLLTPDGQTLEAPVDLYPEHCQEIPLGGLLPVGLVLLDANRAEVFRWSDIGARQQGPTASSPWPLLPDFDPTASAEVLFDQHSHLSLRAASATELARRAILASDMPKAQEHLQDALNYNADDPLLWWELALTERSLNPEEPPSALPNAHYLAPLEPVLRAESFLSQNHAAHEPSPLLRSFGPDDFLEVACLLMERGRTEDASRWLDEAIRHQDGAMLRFLMADLLLTSSRMQTEAASHMAAASTFSGQPPLPSRPFEIAALHRLARAFPEASLPIPSL